MCKIFLLVILKRLNNKTEPFLSEDKVGFRSNRSTVQQILALRLIEESFISKKTNYVYNCFIDFKKALDSVKRDTIWAALELYGVDEKLIIILNPFLPNVPF